MTDTSLLKKQATELQIKAANPELSVWVSASAGTGKTTVLVNRLLRLFLNDVKPSEILCLTYTKAGATEMQNRIYRKTKSWAVMSDEELEKELKNLFQNETSINNDLLTKSRKLFTSLIDNPLPLKIYTIHAFCQSVLKRFPIEAGIPPHFKVMEENDAKVLLNDAYLKLASSVKNDKSKIDTDVATSYFYLMDNISETVFEKIKEDIIDKREVFLELQKKYLGNKKNIFEDLKNKIFDKEIPPEKYFKNPILYVTEFLQKIPSDFKDTLITLLTPFIPKATAERVLKNINLYNPDLDLSFDNESAICDNFEKICKVLSSSKNLYSDIRKENPLFETLFDNLVELASVARKNFSLVKMYNLSVAIINIGFALNDIYTKLKHKQSLMDFEDLITKVKNLFSKENICGWILYKLDGGISHVLIDEAQDTSPLQWDIVNKLTNEFFTTGANKDNVKSFFSVGDRKQSIFSFQGADIEAFEQNKYVFKNKVQNGQYPFEDIPLNTSFRSCKNILATVDKVIKSVYGVCLENENITHIPARDDSGYVELFPLVLKKKETTSFQYPTKKIEVSNAEFELAEMLADKIRYILDNDYIPEEKNKIFYKRRVEPKDIMILVRNRNSAEYLTRALSEKNIPIAGRDKFVLSENIVVEDLISLLKFVLFNYDDLSLAEILKSPLFNLTDDDLFDLCYSRSGTLFNQLKATPKYKNIYDELKYLIDYSKTAFPFEFFDYVINVKNKRENFKKRFGQEIDDVLNAFLSQCLSYNNTKIGKSLSNFLEWFSLNDIELKRDMEQVNNCIRVMTVHGSKGLEAPIIFLYNVNEPIIHSDSDKIFILDDMPIFKISGFGEINERFAEIDETDKKKKREESYRLLYVAMTRARDRLYVMGTGGPEPKTKSSSKKDYDKDRTWYKSILLALNPDRKQDVDSLNAENFDALHLRTSIGSPDVSNLPDLEQTENLIVENIPLPNYLKTPVPDIIFKRNKSVDIYSPLDILNSEITPFEKGTIIHKLLELLSKITPKDIDVFVKNYLHDNEIDDAYLCENLVKLYKDSDYSFIFNKENLAETELYVIEDGIKKQLRVDKVAFVNDDIWIIDYKTDKTVPNTIPTNYKNQLQEYKNAIAKIYPTKKIHTAILWISELKFIEFE